MSDVTKEMDLAVAPESEQELDLARMRHSCAHVMAQAVLELFPGAKLGIGPAIADGFYYDFDLPRPLTPEDLERIERRMEEIKAAAYPFIRQIVTREQARELFRDQPYKLELIDEFPPDEIITTYTHDGFTDLCRGPHVRDTSQIGYFKLLRVSGAYWRGDERRPQLQRIYGTSWPTREQLEAYLHRLAEAERRDHRRLGRELELFHFDPTAPGMPYWLPKGLKILNLLLDFWRQEHEKRGYQEIAAPLINDKSLWETSGHWEHYRENMFLIQLDDHLVYGVKPMNCPNAMVVYNLKKRSYRDLPLRLSDCDILHRYERSGTLHGLLRVRKFQQDDAHIFVTEEQIEEEFARILEIAQLFYGIFGLRYTLRLGTRPDDFMGDPETWDKAEAALQRILDEHAGPGNYLIGEGEGAFYGPKIDILMEDALGRQWQTGTIQLDFQLPRRFGCTYTDRDGTEKTPVVIHRVIYGSLERFIGILIEHFAGAFPVWLAPVQAVVIPIADRHLPYAYRVRERLREAGLRVEVDDSDDRMQAKIRNAQLQKVPYMLVVGDREAAEETIAVRLRTNENLGAMPLERFLAMAQRIVADKSLELVTEV